MKILVIGQAPPDVKQAVPYDTTMFYDWLGEIGIDKDTAQKMFIFDSVGTFFPGRSKGGHNKPSQEDMDSHWPELETKIQGVDKVWILGNVAYDYFSSKEKTWSCNLEVIKTIHPSRRNFSIYKDNKDAILDHIKEFLNI